jgi:hypothetical protein
VTAVRDQTRGAGPVRSRAKWWNSRASATVAGRPSSTAAAAIPARVAASSSLGARADRRLGDRGHHSRPDRSLRGLEILTAPVRGGGELGVIRDRGRHTYAAVLLCRGRSFALLDSVEQACKLNAWGDVLSALGRDGSVVERLQWLDVVVSDDGQAAVRHLRRHHVMPGDSAPVRRWSRFSRTRRR